VVHESLLTLYSEYFRAALTGSFQEANKKTVKVDEDPDIFEFFVSWLYHLRFPNKKYRDDPEFIAKWENKGPKKVDLKVDNLVKLYVLGDRYNVPRLRKATINEIFDHYLTLGDGSSTNRSTVQYAYKWLRPKSPLCRLLVDIECHLSANIPCNLEDDKSLKESAGWPHVYLLQTLSRSMDMVSQVRNGEKGWEDFNLKICDYHEHKTAEEKAACERHQKRKRKI
jgi:hypothetical protein